MKKLLQIKSKIEKLSFNEDEEILNGYLECAIWSSGEELDGYSISDIDESSIDDSRNDINIFLEKLKTKGLLDNLMSEMNASGVGHDFWLTRNGHGAGFWDRDLGEVNGKDLGDAVTEVCKTFGEKWPYVGDDKKIYIE